MKRKVLLIIGILFVLILASSCDAMEWPIECSDITSREKLILERADQMGRIKWLTQNQMPSQIRPIPAGSQKTGVPYSSVKEVGGYVGFDVSFYTFLSAVVNPRSVIYTEDLSSDHYHSTNATTYYGTVCSSTVSYALGFDLPFKTAVIPNLPYVTRLEHQCIDSLKVGDMLWRTGHVMMVYDMHYSEEGDLKDITILESASGTTITRYTYEKLKKRISKEKLEAYRSSKEVGEKTFRFDVVDDSRVLHFSLCPNKGDKSVYPKQSDVIINVLDPVFTNLILLKNGVKERIIPIETEDITLSNLDEGFYEAYLLNADSVSTTVSFEVMNTELSVEDLGSEYRIFLDNNYGRAEYVFYVLKTGSMQYYYNVSEEDVIKGYKDIPKFTDGSLFLRFIIRGDYGRAYSSFISLND